MKPNTESAPKKRPRISIAIASGLGLGYLPKAPGTWGSLGGLGLSLLLTWLGARHVLTLIRMERTASFWTQVWAPSYAQMAAPLILSGIGVWAASRAARHAGQTDPQWIVIDEICGQMLAFSLPGTLLNWKYWLLGLILFRVFDIWKPFPARQAEKLPGGWGIMADDWIAGLYAALGLWLARALGL